MAVIARIHPRGVNLAGLLRYLFGPGRNEEHDRPRLVAGWDGAGDLAALEPDPAVNGRRNFRRLVDVLASPLAAALGRPPARPVWHCSLRLAPGDPVRSDADWTRIAEDFMHETGLGRRGDDGGIHWVAVRHGDDHVHLAAILARADGRPERAGFDKRRARAAALTIEARYGLTPTAPADRTAARGYTGAEARKADRQQRREPVRVRLLRTVRAAAVGAAGDGEFFGRLRDAGIEVRLRHSTINPGEVTGYAVGLPGDRAAAGGQVWYSGGRLAPDLTLPRIRSRWADTAAPPMSPATVRVNGYRLAADAVRGAEAYLRTTGRRIPGDAGAVAAAAADLLTATAWQLDGAAGGPATSAARLLERAARDLTTRASALSSPARRIRHTARLVATMGRLVDDRGTALALQLIADMAEFAETLAELRTAQTRHHQAAAARLAAEQLRALAATAPTGTSTSSPAARAAAASFARPGRTSRPPTATPPPAPHRPTGRHR